MIDLEFYSNIREYFSETFVGTWFQYGASGPKENTALMNWLIGISELWVLELGKSLSYSTTPNDGRESFLRFAEVLIEPLHPDILTNDTIRNAFEKLRINGKLDYPSEKSL